MRVIKILFKFLFSRLFLVALMIAIQVFLLAGAVLYFTNSVFYIYLVCHALSFLVVLAILGNNDNPSYKITWIIAILLFPVAGGVFYLAFGSKRMPKSLEKLLERTVEDMHAYLPKNEDVDNETQLLNRQTITQSQYIYNVTGCPMMAGTPSKYYAVGEDMFEDMMAEIKKARRYIMLEFFIIEPGIMWDSILNMLRQKMREGIAVYLMYDDLGTINTLPKGYDKILKSMGIKLCVFNPFRPRASAMLNYRDHRKLLVIDGATGFCGGINLADEYINKIDKHGHWKDTGVMLKGEAVWEMTLLFLQMWQFATRQKMDFGSFQPTKTTLPSDGLVQVFGDSPLDKTNVIETAYLNIISRATKYVYITTPYLIIGYEMEQALCNAALSGIDVRIITPHIYDKWYVHMLTRSHYKRLSECGVKIYEYTPGFMHAKMFIADDNIGMVGTCNMDFRSFYLHFECGVTFYNARIIGAVKKDILDCQRLSHLVSVQEASHVKLTTRLIRAVLRVFAPLF
ncbi:MAG: cardiolipin synthase [Oscillospiraceae bacterium]|jgi:cardiolipin synthase|nr:cardiolipin synthase [Oscillospiraceae bacterium]